MALNCYLVLLLSNVKYKVSAFTLLVNVALKSDFGVIILLSSDLDFFSQLVVSVGQINLLL